MNCDFTDWSTRYVSWDLSPDEMRLYAEHLAGCESCRIALGETTLLSDAVLFATAEAKPRPEVGRRVLRQVRSDRRRRLALPWVAAAILASFGLGTWIGSAVERAHVASAPADYFISDLRATISMRTVHGEAVMVPSSRRMMVLVAGLRPLPHSQIYELWLVTQSGTVAAGPLQLDAGGYGWFYGDLPTLRYHQILVSVESLAHGSSPRGPVVLTGSVRPG